MERELIDRIAALEEDVEALWGLAQGATDPRLKNSFQAEAEEAEAELERLRCQLDAMQAEAAS
jgi:hypothetical protein